MLTRRHFLAVAAQAGAGLAVAPASLLGQESPDKTPVLVNDIHSQLNPTYVNEIAKPDSLAGLQDAVQRAGQTGGQ